MMAVDSLRVMVLFGMSFCWPSWCRRACSACAFAPHFALSPAQPSNAQASCLERGWPAAVAAFAGVLAAGSTAPLGRRCPERQRGAKAEGKTKVCGTCRPAKPVCTWGVRGTARLRRRAAGSARSAPIQVCPRASHDGLRHSFQEAQP